MNEKEKCYLLLFFVLGLEEERLYLRSYSSMIIIIISQGNRLLSVYEAYQNDFYYLFMNNFFKLRINSNQSYNINCVT